MYRDPWHQSLGLTILALTLVYYICQEHPSATVSLLPPNILAKIKDNVYSDKVLRYRAIPPSHKLQVTIFLTLPESHYNLELGMFQVFISIPLFCYSKTI